MDTKTPYELRLRMIELSKELLVAQANLARDMAVAQWKYSVEFARDMKDSLPEMPSIPGVPTLEDILAQAEKMNDFVSGKGRK